MKKISSFLLIVISIFFTLSIMAQEKKEEKLPPGMEEKQIGSTKFVVPQGTQFHKKADFIIVESPGEYVGRKLLDVEERLTKIETKLKELSEKIEQLNKALSEIQGNNPTSNKKKE